MENNENNLVEDNMKLAYKIAWDYYNKFGMTFELEELQSICFIGLTKAARRFDEEKDSAFSTFAYAVMRNELLQFYNRYKDKDKATISLSEPIGEDICIEDVLSSDEDLEHAVEKKIRIEKLYEFIGELDKVEQTIVTGYLRGLTTKQLSEILPIGEKHINTKYRKALNKLRYKFFRLYGGDI